MKYTYGIILLSISLALTGCGQSPGEKALEALRARESNPSYTEDDLSAVAVAYTEAVAKYCEGCSPDRSVAGAGVDLFAVEFGQRAGFQAGGAGGRAGGNARSLGQSRLGGLDGGAVLG
ncbi:MAG: hypothetical protein K0R17_2715 [Rariglobus sp.]|nr:hypothetical protein [Rariglobus sp.]